MNKDYRQGDVILEKISKLPDGCKKLNHLILAEGEVTGHKHQVINGDCGLYEKNGTLFLAVESDMAIVKHDEHKPLETVKRGVYEINIPQEWDYVGEESRKIQD